jgi:hypothetical protein
MRNYTCGLVYGDHKRERKFCTTFFFAVLTIVMGYKYDGGKKNFDLIGVPGKCSAVGICTIGNYVQRCTTDSGYEPAVSIFKPPEIIRADREASRIGDREITF